MLFVESLKFVLLYVFDCVAVNTNIFLTLFGESGFDSSQGGNRKTNKQQGEAHEKEKNKTKGMSVRLVVSKQTVALGSTATNILTMLLTTTKVVIICADSQCHFYLFFLKIMQHPLIIGLFTTVHSVCTLNIKKMNM